MCCQMFNSILGLLSAMNKCKEATWGGKISGVRCSNPRVQQVTPAASLSRILQNAPLPIQGPPLTAAPAHGPAEFPSGRSLNSPQVKVCLYLFMDSLIPCHVLKSAHNENETMHGRVEKGEGFKSQIGSFIHSFFFSRYFLNPYYVHL